MGTSCHLCLSCFSLAIQVFHIGNLLTLAFSLGCAFAPNTDALIGFRFLCEHSTRLLSLLMLSWLQQDYQQVHPSHAVKVLSEIYLRLTNEHPLWRCTLLDPLLVQMPLIIHLHAPMILFLGPAVGPIAGGFIVQTVGIKWVFITIASLYLSTCS